MALSLCLLLDETADQAVRRLWRQLEDDGLPSLPSHTHGRHVPHVTLAALTSARWEELREIVPVLPVAAPEPVVFQALGAFTRSRCSMVPAVSAGLLQHHEQVVTELTAAGLEVHRHYVPGAWVPHLTVATRTSVDALPRIARRVYEVLPLVATLERTAVVDTSTGELYPLPG